MNRITLTDTVITLCIVSVIAFMINLSSNKIEQPKSSGVQTSINL